MEIIKCLEKSNVIKDFKVLVLEFFEGGLQKIAYSLDLNLLVEVKVLTTEINYCSFLQA